jgi:hypothetical protein
MYRLAIFAQRQYGELFKALFDQFHDQLKFVDKVVGIAGALGADTDVGFKERYAIVSRYLRWHRIRPRGEKNVTPEAWQAELQRRGAEQSGMHSRDTCHPNDECDSD